ncbi:MAG: GNAT family N-acetyltransferase [Promethearchaeota archaeon]
MDEKVDIETLSKFIFKVYYDRRELNESITFEAIRKELIELRNSYRFIIFYAYSNEELMGLLLLSISYPKFGIVGEWQPIVLPNIHEDKIAQKLIEKCIESAEENDISRFEICFPIENEKDKDRYQEYVKWYEASGFHKVMEEVSMSIELATIKFESISFSENIRINTIEYVDIDELIKVSQEVFENSQDIMYLDLNNELKNTVATEWFNKEKAMIKDSSIVLLENEKIIGFLILRSIKNDVQISPFGLLPDYRKKGLGKKLLLYCLEKAKQKGYKYVNLDVALENVPAYKLYSKVGFKRNFSTIILALNYNQK